MAELLKVQVEDENGNIFYMHTSADIVFTADGTSVAEELDKKVTIEAGDIANTKIATMDSISTQFPDLVAGEKAKVSFGKIKKFIADFKSFKTGIITLGHLVNNGQTTASGYALDARYGKTLYDLYSQLNSDLAWGEYTWAMTEDLNSIKPVGKFAISVYSGSAVGNPAPGNSGGVIAFGVSDSVIQMAWMYSGTFVRRCTRGTWGAWEKNMTL